MKSYFSCFFHKTFDSTELGQFNRYSVGWHHSCSWEYFLISYFWADAPTEDFLHGFYVAKAGVPKHHNSGLMHQLQLQRREDKQMVPKHHNSGLMHQPKNTRRWKFIFIPKHHNSGLMHQLKTTVERIDTSDYQNIIIPGWCTNQYKVDVKGYLLIPKHHNSGLMHQPWPTLDAPKTHDTKTS